MRLGESPHCAFILAWLASLLTACGGGSEPSVASNITLNESQIAFDAIGQTLQLSTTITDQRGDPFEATPTWSSTSDAVASVSPTGLVTAQGPGQAQVTAAVGEVSAIATVTVTQTVTTFKIVSGDNQASVAGLALPLPLVVEADDALNHPIAGVTVAFSITQGGGTVTPTSAVTGPNGRASTILTVGPTAGEPQRVMASVAGAAVAGLSFQASVTNPPASIVVFDGNGQHAAAGAAVPTPPAVRVLDADAQPVRGVSVTFEVSLGGGSITGPEVITNANGVASVGRWTLGPSGVNTLGATVATHDLAGEPAIFVATTDAPGYNIVVRFLSSTTSSQLQAFAEAETRWEQLITGDLTDIPIVIPAGWCQNPDLPALSETIDDLLIFAQLQSIDGPGGTLGAAGPCLFRTTGQTALAGIMFFDVDDLELLENEGILDKVVLHEMGHVLGFGTLWDLQGLLTGAGGSDPHFTGAQAIAQFNAAGGNTYSGPKVPVENDPNAGPGTRDSHWRETVFETELMTGFITLGGPNPLSKITVASLDDMGYTVNLNLADPYTLPTTTLRMAGPRRVLPLGNDVLRPRAFQVDASGRITEMPSR